MPAGEYKEALEAERARRLGYTKVRRRCRCRAAGGINQAAGGNEAASAGGWCWTAPLTRLLCPLHH